MIDRRPGRVLRRALLIGLLSVSIATPSVLADDTDGAPTVDGSAEPFSRIDVAGIDPQLLPGVLRSGQVTVMVEVAGEPVARRQAEARRQGREMTKAERAAARAELEAAEDRIRPEVEANGGQVVSQVQDAYNGMRVTVDRSKLASLAAVQGVTGIHAIPTYTRSNTFGVQYVNGNDVWQDYGQTGEGVRVAIIDTGVDYYHANFGGSGDPEDFANDNTRKRGNTFPTDKVVEGWDFVGDDYDASGEGAVTIPRPDPDPLDCNGHGSHVAGSAAGYGVLANGDTFTGPYDATTHSNTFEIGPGSAPEASILAYRVFGCEGSTDVVVEAINQAIVDDADVINMSLGSPFGTNDNPDAIAVENATDAGVVVVTSAGNETPVPYITGSPGTADHSLSVAAIEAIPVIPTANIALSGPTNVQAIVANDATIAAPITAPLLVLPNGSGGIALGCAAADYAGAAGKIVVTLRGVCARVDRAILGQAAGAVAVVMVNTADVLPPFEGEIDGVTIPFLGVRSSTAATFLARNGESATVTDTGDIANPGFGVLASFSSGGPRTGDSAQKPDVTAPGVSIKSTGVGSGTEGVYISGTSMAAPHTAGVAALVVGGNPDWSPTQVRAAIMNTANPALIVSPSNADVRLVGSGAVDARKAIDTPVIAMTENEGAALSYGYDQLTGLFSETKDVLLTNTSGAPVTFSIGTTKQGSLTGYSITPAVGSIVVPANGQASVPVTISMTAAQAAALPPGSTALTAAKGVVTFTVTAGTGYGLRIPYMFVPNAVSNIVVEPAVAIAATNVNLTMTNEGVDAGEVGLFAWTNSDPADLTGNSADLRAAGVSVLPGPALGLPNSDRSLFFVVNAWNRWSNPADVEFDIGIDTKGSAAPEFVVFSADVGLVLAGAWNGQYGSFIVDVKTNQLVDAWVAHAPLNASTMILPVAASDFGLGNNGISRFRIVTLTGFSNQVDAVDTTPRGQVLVSPWNMPIEQGGFEVLTPGQSANFSLDFSNNARNHGFLGWLFASPDDPDGPAQADLISLPPRNNNRVATA